MKIHSPTGAKFDGSSKKLVDTIAEKLVGHLNGMFDVHVSIRDRD